MAKGEVYHHSQFPFHDGQIGDKFFVLLNDPQNDEPYIVVRTTSNLRNRHYQTGCNSNFGDFFVPSGTEKLFPKDTVVQLVETYEFSTAEFLNGCLNDKIISNIGSLSSITLAQLINCVRKLKNDISEHHFKMITR